MTDKELLEEIEREFGSHTAAQDSDSDDLDAFLADLKQTIDPDSQSAPSSKQAPRKAPSGASKRERPAERAPKTRSAPKQKPPKPEAPRKAPKQYDRPEKESRGLTRFILQHQTPINICLICLCLVLIGGIAAVFFFQGSGDPLDGKIMENVVVAGVDVGGMTREEAANAVIAAVGSNYAEKVMTVRLGSSVLSLAPSQTRPVVKPEGAVEEAYAYGRTGSTSQRQQDFRDAQYAPKVISLEPYLSLNTDYIRSAIAGFVESFTGTYTPSGYTLEGEMPALSADEFDSSAPCQTLTLQIGTPGSNFDLDGICQAVLEGYYQNQFDVQIPQEYLADFPEKLDIDAIYRQVHVDAVEAVQDTTTGEVTPGSCGYTFSLENARNQLESAGYGDTITISMEYIVPEKLDFNGSFTETLASFSTPISSNNAYNENLKLLCKQLDGTVLNSGATFSFNTAFVRTEKNGYQKAPRHGDKCADEEIGGGADQVATTLYVAALTSGLTATEKHIADHLCDYTTKGTEISVSANWQDLKLRNPLNCSVKIRAKVTGSQVIIKLLCEEPQDFYVKLETKDGYVTPHGTVFVNKKSADGFKNGDVIAEGADGGTVTLQWVKYDKNTNKELSRSTESVQVPARHTMIASVTG